MVSPSRLASPLASPPAVTDSRNRLTWYDPAGAVQVRPPKVKLGPETLVVIGRQVASLSRIGSVAVTQSTILRSPVVVFWSAGWERSTPESRTPMVMPRPSAFGWSSTKSTAPVSKEGLYGFSAGVFLPGAG